MILGLLYRGDVMSWRAGQFSTQLTQVSGFEGDVYKRQQFCVFVRALVLCLFLSLGKGTLESSGYVLLRLVSMWEARTTLLGDKFEYWKIIVVKFVNFGVEMVLLGICYDRNPYSEKFLL